MDPCRRRYPDRMYLARTEWRSPGAWQRRSMPAAILGLALSMSLAACGGSLANTKTTRPPAGSISTHIELSSTSVVAGSKVAGRLVVTNTTGATVFLPTKCELQWSVGLRSSTIPFSPAFATTLCAGPPFQLPLGTTRFPITLLVTYSACSMTAANAGPNNPACLPNYQMPPLPPGPYEAVWS